MKKLLLITLILLCSCGGYNGVRVERTFTRDRSAAEIPLVEVRNRYGDGNGNLQVIAGSDDSIHLVVEKWATGGDEQKAVEILGSIEVHDFRRVPSGALAIEVCRLESADRIEEGEYGANISIELPASISLDVDLLNGEIRIEGMNAEAKLKTHSGDIEAQNHHGNLDGETSNGDIDVDVTLPDGGKCRLKTLSGNITLSIPDTTSAEIEASTRRGKVEISDLDFSLYRMEDAYFAAKMGDGKGYIDLETANGNITVSAQYPLAVE
jgi:hypothetical protein